MKRRFYFKFGIVFIFALIICSMAIFVNTASVKAFSQPKAELSYDGENFSINNGFNTYVSGSGIVKSSVLDNGYNFSDTTSYIKISANQDVSFTSEKDGLSVAFLLQSTNSKFYLSNESLRPNVTDDFEQLFTVEGENGISASICLGGLYYYDGSSVTYSFPNEGKGGQALLGESKKTVVISIDFENKTIYVYSNGEQVQYYTSANSKKTVIENVINLFKTKLTVNGGDFYLRKPIHSSKEIRNTSSIVLSNFKIFASKMSSSDVKDLLVSSINFPISVKGLSQTQYTVVLNGVGFTEVNDLSRKTAIGINNISSYVTVKSDAENSLISTNDGISFHFFHKSTTNVFYVGNTGSRPNVTDDFEQLLTVEGENGVSAHICTGGLYYYNGSSVAYAFPDANNTALLKTSWKYVSIDVDNVNTKINVYIDGALMQVYDTSNASSTVVRNVVKLFSSKAQEKGGEIFIRKPLSVRTERNSATNILDNMVIADGGLTNDEILSFYDEATGKIRVSIKTNLVDVKVDDLIAEQGQTVSVNLSDVAGYRLEGIYYDKDFQNELELDTKFTNSTTLYAKYSLIEYKITYHYNGGDEVSNNPLKFTIVSDGVTILPATKRGYVFDGWYRTSDFKNQVVYLVEGSYGDIDLFAKYVIIDYKINYVLNGGVFVDVPAEYFNIENPLKDVELVDAWKGGYVFDGWYFDNEYENRALLNNVDLLEDITLYAKFLIEENSSSSDESFINSSESTSSSNEMTDSSATDSSSGGIINSSAINSSENSTKRGCGGVIGSKANVLFFVLTALVSVIVVFKKRGSL